MTESGCKNYILDTNVILHDPYAYRKFAGNNVIIPLSVIEEIDDFKDNQDTIGQNARIFSREISSLIKKGQLSEGVEIENDITFKIEQNHNNRKKLPNYFRDDKIDNSILSIVKYYNDNKDNATVLVSKDINMRIKAHSLGFNIEDYRDDAIDFANMYEGYEEVNNLNDKLMDKYYEQNYLDVEDIKDKVTSLEPNKLFNIGGYGRSSSALGIYKKSEDKIRRLYKGDCAWGIKARNREQRFAFEVLLDDSIPFVSLLGKAGTGKTLLSLAAGLEKVLNEGVYDKLAVLRPIVPMGNDIGYLPGTKEEKLSEWMQPIRDNFEYLTKTHKGDKSAVTYDYMSEYIDMEALTYIRGRSIPEQFIILDEAQNLSSHEMQTVLTRIGEDSKIVLTGDPNQIDHPYLDQNSNGLTYATEKLKDSELSASIILNKGERSQLAEEAAQKL